MEHTLGTAVRDSDPKVVSLRMEWMVMAKRRQTIHAIDRCIRGLMKLRPVFGPQAVDPLIEDYRSVLRAITAVRPNARPSVQELEERATLMRALEQRLAGLMQQETEAMRTNDNPG